jgi:hypothetical protein
MKRLYFTLSLALLPLPALAHPGAHDGFSGWQEVAGHLLGTPFHLALVVGAGAAGIAALRLLRRPAVRKAEKRRD